MCSQRRRTGKTSPANMRWQPSTLPCITDPGAWLVSCTAAQHVLRRPLAWEAQRGRSREAAQQQPA
jgi:hypothetical protein